MGWVTAHRTRKRIDTSKKSDDDYSQGFSLIKYVKHWDALIISRNGYFPKTFHRKVLYINQRSSSELFIPRIARYKLSIKVCRPPPAE